MTVSLGIMALTNSCQEWEHINLVKNELWHRRKLLAQKLSSVVGKLELGITRSLLDRANRIESEFEEVQEHYDFVLK